MAATLRRMRARQERIEVMTQMHATAAEPVLDAGQTLSADLTDSQSSALPAQVISFAIGDEQYGVDIMAVREIKGWSEITHLPKQPEYVRGVLNLRGVIVPIIDLRCRFGQGLTEATALHIVIIVQIASRQVGLLGDRVLDIVSFETGQIQPVPRIANGSRVGFLSGLVTTESGMIAVIDLANLLASQPDDDANTPAATRTALSA
jgi:purine-binding chemotaxis protein CheW